MTRQHQIDAGIYFSTSSSRIYFEGVFKDIYVRETMSTYFSVYTCSQKQVNRLKSCITWLVYVPTDLTQKFKAFGVQFCAFSGSNPECDSQLLI